MKKFQYIVVLMLAFTFIIPVFASDETKSSAFSDEYNDSFMSTMDFMGEVKERMMTLAEKDDPTATEVELCIQYVEVYVRLMNLCSTEMNAPDGKVSAPDYESIDKATKQARLVYSLGAMNGKEIISVIVTAAFGE